jgi:acyl-CoA synthetase (AMP-forming)/AMP-acid ligase II
LRSHSSRLSWRELVALVDGLAADLAARGLRPGDRVAVWLPNRVETMLVLLAASRNGYVCCPSLHRDHTVDEVAALVGRMHAAACFALPGSGADTDRNDIFAALRGLPSLRHVYRLDGDIPWRRGAAEPAPPADPDRVSYLAFTSGTTGIPKGVMHSDNTLLANARALAADWRLDRETVIYSLSPLSHNLGIGALVTAVLTGGELVVHDLPRGASLLDRLVETGATYLVGVPAHAIDLLAELRSRGRPAGLSVKGFRISGAALPSEVAGALHDAGIVPQSGYGMTEAGSHHYTLPDDDRRRIVETSGRCCPGFEVRIWRQDDRDREAAPGEIGEIGSRGASLMLGYFGDQAATEQAFNRDGWFMTGDLGWIDEDGYLHLAGRLKDVVIRGGKKIYPARIEALAMRHPAVARAAGLAVPDPRLGERLCLAVEFQAGAAAESADLLDHLAAMGLSRYDMPEYFLPLGRLPLTASGKVKKADLVEAVRRGDLQPLPVHRERKAS